VRYSTNDSGIIYLAKSESRYSGWNSTDWKKKTLHRYLRRVLLDHGSSVCPRSTSADLLCLVDDQGVYA